ncbi:MAG: WD40 repeat domain-containing protein, partial [Candidatus Promineifilaceae bacterium]|nr:WD40 repeat domain-containing protein [Candidatus Promineifilaceae bacterium]
MAAFIAQDTLIFDDIRTVLDSQTERLSDLEREILIWLAIAREPMTLDGLRDALANPVRERTLLEALRALQRRSLMERRGNGFTLQNVINEYLIDTLVDQIVQEIRDERLRLLRQVNFTGSDLSTSIFADRFGLIYSTAFSPDGRLLAAGSAEGRIRFWNIALGQTIQVFQDSIYAIAGSQLIATSLAEEVNQADFNNWKYFDETDGLPAVGAKGFTLVNNQLWVGFSNGLYTRTNGWERRLSIPGLTALSSKDNLLYA